MFIFLLNKHISGGAELLRLAAIFSRFSLRCVLQFGRVGVRVHASPTQLGKIKNLSLGGLTVVREEEPVSDAARPTMGSDPSNSAAFKN